jgi:hypothetical protein
MDFQIHSAALAHLIRPFYSADEVRFIASMLIEKGALHFPVLSNGFFPASGAGNATILGYHYV